ncbi:uncharacterized protein LOC110843928 [Folsomia candida]|nr:uncharacterized protein LOC110843928 [Folsomia candida]
MTSTYSPESQMNFVIQWFRGWSEFQKEDFVIVLSQLIKQGGDLDKNGVGDDATENNLVNGFKGLQTTSGRPPSLFTCQVKLFNEWWTSWPSAERDKMSVLFKEADPKFYTAVELEMNGESQKLNEDFMAVQKSEVDEKQMSSNGVINKQDAPVFNVTKVLINNGPSSFGSVDNNDNEDANNQDVGENHADNDDEGRQVTNGGNEGADEPIATEI